MKKWAITVLFLFALSSVGLAAPLMDYSKGSVSFDYTYRPSLDFNAGFNASGVQNYYYFPQYKVAGGDGNSNGYEVYSEKFNINGSTNFDGSANIDAGVTIGLGNNWAVQYRQYNPQGAIKPLEICHTFYDFVHVDALINSTLKIKSQEFNLMRKLGPKVSAFVGVVNTNAGLDTSVKGEAWTRYEMGGEFKGNAELRSQDRNTVHLGLVGVANIAKNLDGYGVVSVGSDYRNWEAGIAYNFNKNWQLNVSYRDTKFENFQLASGSVATYDYDATGTAKINDVTVKGWGFGLTYKF